MKNSTFFTNTILLFFLLSIPSIGLSNYSTNSSKKEIPTICLDTENSTNHKVGDNSLSSKDEAISNTLYQSGIMPNLLIDVSANPTIPSLRKSIQGSPSSFTKRYQSDHLVSEEGKANSLFAPPTTSSNFSVTDYVSEGLSLVRFKGSDNVKGFDVWCDCGNIGQTTV